MKKLSLALTVTLLAPRVLVASQLRPQLVLEHPGPRLPSAFLPLADGGLALLHGDDRSLTIRSASGSDRRVLITGDVLDGLPVRLTDLAEDRGGGFLLLDRGVGAVWRVGPTGDVRGRFGFFVAPTRIARGGDGRVYVRDGGNACVTAFEGGRPVASYPHPDAPAWGDRAHRVPVVPGLPGGTARAQPVGWLKPGDPARAASRGEVGPRRGAAMLFSRVLGGVGQAAHVLVASYRPGVDRGPKVMDRWVLGAGPATRQPVPVVSNRCSSCGETYRVGPRGDLWFYRQSGRPDGTDRYQVFRLAAGKGGSR